MKTNETSQNKDQNQEHLKTQFDEMRKSVTDRSINWQLELAYGAGYITAKHETQIQTFVLGFAEMLKTANDTNKAILRYITLEIDNKGISVHSAPREVLSLFLRSFGTPDQDWTKSINEYQKDKMDYSLTFPCPFNHENQYTIQCRAVQPPPACRIEEVEELVPAQPASVRKVRKVVCPSSEVAIANETSVTTA